MSGELREVQDRFQAYLMGKRRTCTGIIGPDDAYVRTRMNIYRDGYAIRLTDILKSDFPALLQVMGEHSFIQLAKRYIRSYPSTFFSIADFGCFMAEFLTTTLPYQKKPALADLAIFEWALSRSVTLPNAPLLTREHLANIPQSAWPNVIFAFQPSIQNFTLHWNAPDVWHALVVDKKPLAFAPLEAKQWSVWRKGVEPFYRKHTPETYFIAQAIEQRHTFAEICEGLSEFIPEEKIAETVVNTVLLWMQDEMLTTIILQ